MGRRSNAAIEAESLKEQNEKDNKENVVNTKENDTKKSTSSENTHATRNSVKIDDSEDIEVISLIPHVSYLDKRTDDMYEWDKAGHVEIMSFEALKDMWRNNKGYFKNLWIKPLDERVLIKFGIKKIYENYEMILDKNNYKRENLDRILSLIDDMPNNIKFSIVNKIKQLIANGDITDINVIKNVGSKLGVDFTSTI